jgi:hypothetical protein
MIGLMFDCINWGGIDCHPDVSVHKYAEKLKRSEDIPLWPIGDELKKIDDICKHCELRPFEIGKRECRVCEETGFTETTGLEFNFDGMNRYKNSYLKCKKYGSHSILLRLS